MSVYRDKRKKESERVEERRGEKRGGEGSEGRGREGRGGKGEGKGGKGEGRARGGEERGGEGKGESHPERCSTVYMYDSHLLELASLGVANIRRGLLCGSAHEGNVLPHGVVSLREVAEPCRHRFNLPTKLQGCTWQGEEGPEMSQVLNVLFIYTCTVIH